MLGQLTEQYTDGKKVIYGDICTYSMRLEFQLKPCGSRQTDKSPTHDIFARGQHGALFHAGKAWDGKTRDGTRNKYDLKMTIPELFSGDQAFMALEDKNGYFVILPPQQDKQAA